MVVVAAQVRQVDVREQRRGEPLACGALPPFLNAEQIAYQLLDGIVAARLERGNQPCHAVTAGRGYVLIAHDAEAVGREHKVKAGHSTQHGFVRDHANGGEAHRLALVEREEGVGIAVSDELREEPPLGGLQPRQHLVVQGRFALRRGEHIGHILPQLRVIGD